MPPFFRPRSATRTSHSDEALTVRDPHSDSLPLLEPPHFASPVFNKRSAPADPTVSETDRQAILNRLTALLHRVCGRWRDWRQPQPQATGYQLDFRWEPDSARVREEEAPTIDPTVPSNPDRFPNRILPD